MATVIREDENKRIVKMLDLCRDIRHTDRIETETSRLRNSHAIRYRISYKILKKNIKKKEYDNVKKKGYNNIKNRER